MRLILAAAFTAFTTAAAYAQTDSSTIFLQKGLEEKGKGRAMEAYKQFDKAYSYNKTNKDVVHELANSLLGLRRYAQAREKFLELEKLGVKSADLYKNLMTLSFNMRQYPDAIKYAGLVKQLNPNEKVAFYVGKAHYDDENYGEAIKQLTVAMQEDPTNAEAPYMIARAYSDMNNHKQAVPFFEKAIALQPDNARWMYELGLIYYAIPDDKNSLKSLLLAGEKGLKRDNEYLENLAIAYLNNKQTDKGMEILKESLTRRPTDMNLLGMLAEACYDVKRYDEAIGYWDQVLGLDKQNASALYMIGMSYQKKGDKANGQALCNKAIQMDPNLSKNRQKVEVPGGL
jgi:tetratricopeptide (TPR) repeat protein